MPLDRLFHLVGQQLRRLLHGRLGGEAGKDGCQWPGCPAFGSAAELDQGQVGKLGEGHVAAPLSQMGSQLLQHLQDRLSCAASPEAQHAARLHSNIAASSGSVPVLS